MRGEDRGRGGEERNMSCLWKAQIMVSVLDASVVFLRFVLENNPAMDLEGPDKQTMLHLIERWMK